MIRALATCILLLATDGVAVGQAPNGSVEERRRETLRKVLDDSIASNEFYRGENDSELMTALPVHRWTNNERDPLGQGLMALWIDRGRPIAVASIFPWNGNLIHELESLSRGTFICRRDGQTVWSPREGIRFDPVANAEKPAESAVVRLRQMKGLADRFTVTMVGWNPDNSDREVLRRLPRELYRYHPEATDVLDGAVFAYVKGTDPETLLVLEAVPAKEAYQWQYALVRQTSGGLEAQLDNLLVWSAAKHIPRRDPQQTWISLHVPLNLAAPEGISTP